MLTMIQVSFLNVLDVMRESCASVAMDPLDKTTIFNKEHDDQGVPFSASSSVSSINSDDEDTDDDMMMLTVKKPRHTVGFQEECNVIHAANHVLSDDEVDHLWYSQDEIVAFYEDCQRRAGTVTMAAQLDHAFWTHRLHKDYQAFCTSNNAGLQSVVGSIHAFDTIATHGLAIWATPAIDQDLRRRCAAQRQQILLIQAKTANAANVPLDRRADMIYRASCTWSRPARLLARHLGQASMAATC